ncbi:hypothetical protein AADZ90_013095 [Aestuariibius sp. 2305UL40-4]|uniref:hypothetical protein n=1 Tax=Aestuariibius violaceus TaxID=3234132 RepID=UPI00345ED430
MGLDICVGLLADLSESDPDGRDTLLAEFAALNRLLSRHRLPAHREPANIDPDVWGMYGYSGLHYLRRLAAHLDADKGKLPEPGGVDSHADPILEAYFRDIEGATGGGLRSLFQKRKKVFERTFDHLIVQGDAEGVYIPLDFPDVLFDVDGEGVRGGMVGSTPRLLAECERLAGALSLPLEMTTKSEALWEASESQGHGKETWQRYGIESFTCASLIEACRKSMETGAAIVFV